MLEKLEQLRRAPYAVRERVTALVTIAAVALITLIWFGFFATSFFSAFNKPPLTTSSAATTTPQAGAIRPPFSQ